MTAPILAPESIQIRDAAPGQEEAIREAGRLLIEAQAVEPAYIDAMFERERTVSTYMGNYLAIPHGTNDSKDTIKRSAIVLTRYESPVDWGGNEVRFVVGIAGMGDEHLGILSKIAIVFSEDDSVKALLQAPTARHIYDLLEAVNTE